MKLVLKYKIEIILVLCLLTLYFLLRLPNLTLQPIFADEAIYIRWAQVMRAEPTLRFVSLQDGKTPLFMWAMTPLFKVFKDPLLAGRFLSVLAGFGTFLGALFLGWKFFNPKVGLWAAFLLTITPYIVFFDRMALVDSMFSAFVIWSLIFALWLIKSKRLDLAMILGYMLGGGILTKTPGMFNFLGLPVTLIALDFKDKKRTLNLLKLVGLWVVAVLIGMVMYNALRLGPGFDNLSARNQDYIFSPTRLLQSPLDPFIPHFHDMADWFPKMLTIPVLLAMIAGIILAFTKRNRWAMAICLWSLLPLLTEMALLKTFTARYLLFTLPPLICLGAWAVTFLLGKIKLNKILVQVIAVLIFIPLTLYFDFLLLTNPFLAPLPKEEKIGYFEEWTAGYGFAEIAKFLKEKAQKELVVVGTEGSFGTLPDGLYIYLDKTANIAIIGGRATISAQLKESAWKHPTYFVGNKSRIVSGVEGAKLIKEFPKPVSAGREQNAILLYEVEKDPKYRI